MALSFRGGIHPEYHKEPTRDKAIKIMPAPSKLYYPVSQHIGAPCEPTVKVGDEVKIGQIIADSSAPVSSPIHASVSGKVTAIDTYPHPAGGDCLTIVVENDGLDTKIEGFGQERENIDNISAEELLSIVRKAGIVGMGGAGFPTHVKMSSAQGKIDTLLINGAECEPYLSSDHRLMVEKGEEIIGGIKILKKFFGLQKATLCIEDNKKDAINNMQRLAKKEEGIEIAILKTKYPQGGEKQIIKAVTGREVPGGKLPADVKCVVMNTESVASVYRAVKYNISVYQRIITVSGDCVDKPSVLLVRLGTPFSDVFEFCGGFAKEPAKIINGGPMMGISLYTPDVPVIKTTSGILALSEDEVISVKDPICIRCGRCVGVCPVNLEPLYLSMFYRAGRFDEAEKYRVTDCIECGSCSFICPGRINLVQEFRAAKLKVMAIQRKRQAK